jgi:uncharacterized Rossmann fold enzyme
MRRVELKHKLAGGTENQVRNILSCMKRKLPEFLPERNAAELLQRMKVPVAIVGSGPSIADYVEDIRNFKGVVIAINAAHDYLVDRGVNPHMMVAVDPRIRIAKGFRKPHKDCLYLIASQCHPGVFNMLKGHRIAMWHSACSAIDEIAKQLDTKMGQVHGGTTATLRALAIAYLMGFRMFHLYGVDSSFTPVLRNIDGIKPEKTVEAECGGKRYLTDHQMMSQAMEMTQVLNLLPEIRVTSHGDSLMTAVLTEASKYRHDCYDSADLHRVRPKATTSVYGGITLVNEACDVPGGDHTADDRHTALHEDGTHGVHVLPVSGPVPVQL